MNPVKQITNHVRIANPNAADFEGPIWGLPDETIECISSCIILAANWKSGFQCIQKEKQQDLIEFVTIPKGFTLKQLQNDTQLAQLLKDKLQVDDKFARIATDHSEKLLPWRDLASFAGTCKRIYSIVNSKVYSDLSIMKVREFTNGQICLFNLLKLKAECTSDLLALDIQARVEATRSSCSIQ